MGLDLHCGRIVDLRLRYPGLLAYPRLPGSSKTIQGQRTLEVGTSPP